MSKLTPSRATRRGAILGTLALGGAAILSIKACADHPGRIWRSLHGPDTLPEPSADMFFAPPWRVLSSNLVPDHDFGPFPNPGNPFSVRARRRSFIVPSDPVAASDPMPIGFSEFGVMLNGIPLDPAGPHWRGDRRSGWQFEVMSPNARPHLGLDDSNAHVHPDGVYHYHGPPSGLLRSLGVADAPPKSMVLLGFAADGFPIYWRWGHLVADDPASPLVELHSGYVLRSGTRDGGPGGRHDGTFVEDYVYDGARGRLDPLNGRIGVTPDWPAGIFHYIITAAFPWIPRFFRGQPHPSFSGHRVGPGIDGVPPALRGYRA